MINEEATFRWKGYRSTDLSKGSHKKVWAVCDCCGTGRWISRGDYRDLCSKCAHYTHTPEACKKISMGLRGKSKSKEHRQNIGAALKGRIVLETTKKKLSDAKKGKYTGGDNWIFGKHLSKETRHKISKSRKGKCVGEDNGMFGKTHTPETCEKLSVIAQGRIVTEETRNKLSVAGNGRFHTEETREKMRKSKIGKPRSAETCEKIRKARIGKYTGENNPAWQGGISFEPYCPKFNEEFKESIRERFGRVCFLCPTTEEENGKKLSVHHVQYEKNCLCDDIKCEFVPLCESCHGKTNHNREHWEVLILEKLAVTT